jgi:radical SAM protein with 4Fe4S-binding SPASM domain
MNGLTTVNVELTDRCNKSCWMCGQRQYEKQHPDIIKQYGEMEFKLVEKIASELPENIVVQFHNYGEPLLYSKFGEAVKLFSKQIRSVTTNGKLLLKKYHEIVNNLDTIVISVFEKDIEAEIQYELVKEFVLKKGCDQPRVIIRQNGEVDVERYQKLNLQIVKRKIHSALNNIKYGNIELTMPEIGICLDFLNHLVIRKNGDVSICVHFDVSGCGIIGNVQKESLKEIWNSKQRMQWLNLHKIGKRELIPLCSTCEYWGVPL